MLMHHLWAWEQMNKCFVSLSKAFVQYMREGKVPESPCKIADKNWNSWNFWGLQWDGGNAGEAWGRSKQMQQTGLVRMVCHRCHAMATGGSTWDMEEWRKKLPEKKVPLYSHSLPCIEAWLNSLGFFQSRDDRAVWLIQRPDWHAQLSLDITELYIRWVFLYLAPCTRSANFSTLWELFMLCFAEFDKGHGSENIKHGFQSCVPGGRVVKGGWKSPNVLIVQSESMRDAVTMGKFQTLNYLERIFVDLSVS